MSAVEALGYLASALVFSSFCMKRMIALRLTAILSNIAFILYGALGGLTPILALHAVLLPLNLWRAVELERMVRRTRGVARGDMLADWLRPYARSMAVAAGEKVFSRGDRAERLYFIVRGTVGIDELGLALGPHAVFGEMGMFSETRTRTQSATALEAVELLWVGEDDLALICHQHPALTLHLVRLVTSRMIANAARAGGPPLASEARRLTG